MSANKCLFCLADLAPGSAEHVFLASLGGRVVTSRATCVRCNNYFATSESGKIDDALAESFAQVRCALMIWTGRDEPPPTLRRAGTYPDGREFDVAPGFVPIPRRAAVPDFSALADGEVHTAVVRDVEEARHFKRIAERRGVNLTLRNAQRVTRKAPSASLPFSFDVSKSSRGAAKTAVIGACVLYGNEPSRAALDTSLLAAVKFGNPDISTYAGWDYTNDWPSVLASTPHSDTPNARASGFEHSLIVLDVGTDWVAYVEFFGAFRFSVRLGARSGLTPKGMALNPRSRSRERFNLSVASPEAYHRRASSCVEEYAKASAGIKRSFEKVISTWDIEAAQKHIQNLAGQLVERLAAARDEEEERAITSRWAEEIATLESGCFLSEDIGSALLDNDEPA